MATAKKKAPSAKSTSGTTTATPSAVPSSSASPSSTTGGGSGGGGGESKKKKSPPPPAAAAPTAVPAAPSDETNTTAIKEQDSPPPNDVTQLTRCTEKDVLLGRGKRVSEWPGNVHFRQVVNRYREEYATSERANKVKIAAAVIAAVQDVGGRFVREVPGGGSSGGRSSWYVVTHDRAVEKTCQALREKEKASPPNVSPFVGGDAMDDYNGGDSPLRQKRSRLSPAGASPSPRTKRKILHQAAAASEEGENQHADSDEETSSDDDDDDDDDDSSSSDSDDDDDVDSSTTSEDTEEGKGKHSNAKITKPSPAAAAAAAAAAAQIKGNKASAAMLSKQPSGGSSVASTMTASPSSRTEVALVRMNRLRAFRSRHGHAAVPPIWPCDQTLADWCIQQRQLHREIIVVANNPSLSSSKRPANQEESQQSSIDVSKKDEIKEPLEKESSSDQKMAETGASEQNASVDKGDDLVTAATTTTAPTATATTTNTPNDHHVNNKQQQQQAEPYRRGSSAEFRLIEALDRLGFCWDYAAWHWEHQYQLLVAQIAPTPAAATKQDVTQQAAALNKTTGGNKSDDATTEKERHDTSATQADAKAVHGEPAKKDDADHMDVDKETRSIINNNVNMTKAKPENGNAMDVEQNHDGKKEETSTAKDDDEGKKDFAPTVETPETRAAAATASTAATNHNQGVIDGILCTILTDETLEWMDDQQDQYHNQGHQLVSKERRDKLEAMGIYF